MSRWRQPAALLAPAIILMLLAPIDHIAGVIARSVLPIYLSGIVVLLMVKFANQIWQDRFWIMGLIKGRPIDLRQARVRALFDSYAGHFDRELRDDLLYRGPEIAAKLISPHLTKNERFDILDLGCGTGLAAPVFNKWTATITGCDLSDKMLKKAHQLGLYGRLEQMDILGFMAKNTNSFDLILALDVLIYIENSWNFYRAAAKSCRQGSYLLVTTELPLGKSAEQPIDHKCGRRRESRDVTISVAVAAGFELIDETIADLRYEAGQPVKAGIYLWRQVQI